MSQMLKSRQLALPLALALTMALTGCKHTESEQVMGWSLIEPAERHPIMVTQSPTNLDVEVLRGRTRLTPEQRASVIDFVQRYKKESTTGQLMIAAPSGAPNEVSAVSAAGTIRSIARAEGLSWSQINSRPYTAEDGNPMPPVRLSFVKQTAEAPECGRYTTNLAVNNRNMPTPEFGCATQANIAAMVDTPQDLLTARTQTTPRDSARRDVIWDKWTKGETTSAQRGADEKARTKE